MAGNLSARSCRSHNADHVQRWKLGMQISPGHAEFFQGRGAKRGEQHIAARQKFVQLRLAFVAFQIGLDDFHTSMQMRVRKGGIQAHGVGSCAFGRTSRWQGFELGAFSAHVCQAHQRSRTRQVKRHTQDANAFETAVGLLKIRLCHELVSMCLLGFA